MVFMLAWMFCFVTLLVTVVVLHFLYRWRGSDLELMSWGRELALALVASALQAGVYWAVIALSGRVHWSQHALGFAVVMICYKLGHLTEMTSLELKKEKPCP